MIEIAFSVHDYLPLRRPIFDDMYINSLWTAFEQLTTDDNRATHGFSLTAFHLLFMTAVQHKMFRLHSEMHDEYVRAFTLALIREEDKRVLLNPKSAFDLSRMRERSMFSLFEIVGLDAGCIKECKRIVDQRNEGFMHATGSLPTNTETAIENYLAQLDTIQNTFLDLNNTVAHELISEMEPEDEKKEFLEKHLYLRALTRSDFAQGALREHFGTCVDEEI